MTLTRLAVGLEPLNALDVAHIVRPDPSARANESWVPRWPRTRGTIKQNKELPERSDRLTKKSSRRRNSTRLEVGIFSSLTHGPELASAVSH